MDQRGLIGIGVDNYGSSTITNCDITVNTSGATYSFWNAGVYFDSTATASVRNSVIKVTGANYNRGADKNGMLDISISNSRIEAIGTSNTLENIALRNSTVTNSEIVATGTGTGAATMGGSKIGASLIVGGVSAGAKVVNCWDGSFNPIPNQ